MTIDIRATRWYTEKYRKDKRCEFLRTKNFINGQKKQNIHGSQLKKSVKEIEKGLYDTKLGSGIYKKRLSLGSKGKRGGVRTILAFKMGKVAVFILGFKKNELDNISDKKEDVLRDLAKIYLNFSNDEFDTAIHTGDLIEVHDEKINS